MDSQQTVLQMASVGSPFTPPGKAQAIPGPAISTATDGTEGSTNNPSGDKGALKSQAPKVGSRIEVLWRIEPPDSATDGPSKTPVERWWGATVQDCTREKAGSAVKPDYADYNVHVLLYDAYGEFAQDVSRVVFIPGSSLVDLSLVGDENKGVLDWKMEGDDLDVGMSAGPLSLETVIAEQTAMVQEAGISTDADLEVLSQYPANVQIRMATGYRKFADNVKQMLAELASTQPPGYVITEADVEAILAKLQGKST